MRLASRLAIFSWEFLMRFITSLSVLAVAAAASFGARAQSIDVRVTGTVTPPACVPTLVGGGVVDYGNIPVSSLNRSGFTVLPEKDVPFTIGCDAPTRVALGVVDNREASHVAGIPAALNGAYIATTNFGLGTVSGANVGGYVLRMRQGSFTADGTNAYTVINATSGSGSWANTSFGIFQPLPTFRLSWSQTQGGNPVAFSNLSGTMTVEAALNRGDALPLDNEVPLDGLATLELVYL
ncbi:DUF1120 domain-containing protein [Oceanisphaera sp. KMM 10153]|uniref:DUF1120 domain-containing protein n=1 Tax=Oceanisphaera submarina TaxID=3390193 RepID=UPI003975989C